MQWDNADRLAFRYWKMSRVVMVITSEHIDFITSAEGTSDKANVSRVITITTSDIFQCLKANRSAITLQISLLDSIYSDKNLIRIGIGFYH